MTEFYCIQLDDLVLMAVAAGRCACRYDKEAEMVEVRAEVLPDSYAEPNELPTVTA